jgi:hypothetical protein
MEIGRTKVVCVRSVGEELEKTEMCGVLLVGLQLYR